MALRYDASTLSRIQKTSNGGIRVDARLARTGIFTYKNPDGSERREYRPSDEVFKEDSLKTFSGIPVTIGHPGLVTTQNWKDVSVGHVGDVVQKEPGQDYVIGQVTIQRQDAIEAIQGGKLRECSVGYQVDVDATPGEFEGQRYDAVQRNIRANHLALIPRGVGRAGRDVELRLDSTGDEICYTEASTMPDEVTIQTDTMNVRVDGQAEIDKLKGENEVLRAELKDLKDPKRFDAAVSARISLVDSARKVLGSEYKADGKTDREIKVSVIQKHKADFRADSRSDDYVNAAFELSLEFAPRTSTPALGQLRKDANDASGNAENPLEVARKKNAEEALQAWKRPLSAMNKVS